MARARNIKPGFFKNDELAELTFEARLCFIGLWTIADCFGRFEFRPKRIKAEIFPYDPVDIEAIMNNLEQYRFIRKYSVQGRQYIEITNFVKHQNPHKNERVKGSEIPAPEDEAPEDPEPQGPQGKPDKIGTSTDENGTARADSPILIPDSPFLNPDDGEQQPPAPDEEFVMHLNWKEGEHFKSMMKMSAIPESHLTDEARTEFISHWMSETKTKRNQAKWENAFLKSLNRTKHQKTKVQPSDSLHTFDNVDYTFGVQPDGSF